MGSTARGALWAVLLQFAIYQVSSQQHPQYLFSNYGANVPQARPNIPAVPQKPAPPTKPALTALPPGKPAKSDLHSGPLDSNVLNNLAIALQLLIVSNIMNMPPSEPLMLPTIESHLPLEALASLANVPKYESLPTRVYSPLSYLEQPKTYEVNLPNSNFLGSSSFADPVLGALGVVKPNPRSSMTLMSPYDALGTSLADSLSSPFSYSKKDFQSPYASLLAAEGGRDMFSLANLF